MESSTTSDFNTDAFANLTKAQLCTYCGTTLWMSINISTASATVLGNSLTVSAILFSKKLSTVIANYFVFSLAVSDLLVGLSIPYHMCFYIMTDFGNSEPNCLFRFVLTAFACASSIFNLFFIATDRYIAIVHPFHYKRCITKRTALALITIGWITSFSLAVVPVVWNDWREGVKCEVINVLPNNYLKFIISPLFVLIWMMMFILYSRICKEASGHARRIRGSNSIQNILALKDTKSFQVMLLILGCFTICWLPYFVLTLYARTTRYKSATLYEVFFNLAVANSSMNPVIYAWKNKTFRNSFVYLVKCHKPYGVSSTNFVTNHIPSKKNSVNGICNNVSKPGNILSSEITCQIGPPHIQCISINENSNNNYSDIRR
ncbi:hypothetical protein NQ315_004565 [Exocentrus adspersus]|uniref:G-protein coupled receptors family 1 profile domain-containing protein n=1 Tax=Exocentrus adspersus TaxID=1586481 RepID=A0AAV8VN41_9CUCU|nr:hypothetical protein NQ315_004565 [Exocentrus adspersus]